ncbi:hypothetical protein [Yersinia phage vB_YenM_P778]
MVANYTEQVKQFTPTRRAQWFDNGLCMSHDKGLTLIGNLGKKVQSHGLLASNYTCR